LFFAGIVTIKNAVKEEREGAPGGGRAAVNLARIAARVTDDGTGAGLGGTGGRGI
jgi:hypothetical protein